MVRATALGAAQWAHAGGDLWQPVGCYVDGSLYGGGSLQRALEDIRGGAGGGAFQLLTHGRPGELLIGGEWSGPEAIAAFLRPRMGAARHLNVYGCEFAKGEKGLEAVKQLERSLGVTVAASTNITGKDGDWDLEVGQRSAAIAVLGYAGNLQYAVTDDYDGDGVINGLDLDDDNDGIFDTVECPPSTSNMTEYLGPTNYSFNSWISPSTAPPFPSSAWVTSAGQGITYPSNLVDGATGTYLHFKASSYFGVPRCDWQGNTLALKYNFLSTNYITQFNIYNDEGQPADGIKDYKIDIYNDAGTLVSTYTGVGDDLTSKQVFILPTPLTVSNGWSYVITVYSQYCTGPGTEGAIHWREMSFSGPSAGAVTCDFDGDGIPNDFDLDSDNDGCVDAIEGGGAIIPSQLVAAGGVAIVGAGSTALNQNLCANSNCINSSGVPTIVGNDGQFSIGTSQNASSNTCLDSDGDGVPDDVDLDDDNDGILDTVESTNCALSTRDLSTFTFNNSSVTSTTSNTLTTAAGSWSSSYSDQTLTLPIHLEFTRGNSTGNSMIGLFPTTGNQTPTNYNDGGYKFYNSTTNVYGYFTSVWDFTMSAVLASAIYSIDIDETGYVTVRVGGVIKKQFQGQNTTYRLSVSSLTPSQTYQNIKLSDVNSTYICSDLDTDGDTVPNHLDTDSDNDGCTDAYEAGTMTTNVNTVPSPYGANGFADSKETTAESGVYNGTYTYSNVTNNTIASCPQPCSDPTLMADNCDFDGDGINNDVDLDDDNDGVLDTVECGAANSFSNYSGEIYTACPNLTPQGTVCNATGWSTPSCLAGEEAQLMVYDPANSCVSNKPATVWGASSALTAGADGKNWFGMHSLSTTDGEQMQTVISSIAPNTYEISLWAGYTLDDLGYFTNPGIIQVYGVQPSEADYTQTHLLTTFNITNQLVSSNQVWVKYTATVNTTMTYDRIVFAARSTSAGLSYMYLDNLSIGNNVTSCPDTDGDGIPNSFDLDSDNDGCPDAIEGGGSFDSNDLTSADNLCNMATCVDADGVPTITGSPQGVGTSQDSTMQDLNCPINTTTAENDINQVPAGSTASGNVLTNDTDAEGDGQSVQSATGLDASGNPVNIPLGTPTGIYDANGALAGVMTINGDGTYTFVPASGYSGTVPVEMVIVDDNGVPATDGSTLTIEVLPVVDPSGNNPPVVQDDTNTVEAGGTVTTCILCNDSDPDGDVLTVQSVSGSDASGNPVVLTSTPQNVYGANGNLAGQASVDASGNVVFTAAPTFTGEVPFAYTATDGNGGTDTGTLTITVEPANATDNDTYGNDDAATGLEGQPQTGNVLDNDNDPEGDTQTVNEATSSTGSPLIVDGTTANTLPSGGTLAINPDGTYTYTPAPGYVGTEVITLNICDDGTPQACEETSLYLTTLANPFIDFGDAPVIYPVASHTGNLDTNHDNIPDPDGAVWFGPGVSFETTSKSSGDAQGDTFDDGMTVGTAAGNFPTTMLPSTTYNVDLNLSSNGSATVYYGMWIDYDNDGTYDQFYSGSSATTDLALAVESSTASVSITTPTTISSTLLNIRLRADDAPLTSTSFEGALSGGEVEDYQVSVVLPVELLYFKAAAAACDVELTWATATEENNAYFVLEHSTNGRIFKALEVIKGAGNSLTKQTYSTMHKNAGRGVNYYRLKQVDEDDTYEYSKIASATTKCRGSVDKIQVSPNPTYSGLAKVSVSVDEELEITLEVIDVVGRVISAQTLNVLAGNNNIDLDLTKEAAGVFFVKVKSESLKGEVVKLVKTTK